jgi:hypothetical protein
MTATIDEELLRERIAPGVQDFDGLGGTPVTGLDAHQQLQPVVLVLQVRIPLRRRRSREQVLLQRGVLLGERLFRREVAADPRHRFARELDRAMQRIEHDRRNGADALEVAVTGIGEKKDEREDAEEREPRQRRGSAMEERRRVD